MITDVRLRCGSKDKKRGLNAVQASRPRYSAIPVLAIQLQVSSLRIRESFAGLFIPQEPIPEGSVIIPNAAAVVKGFSGPFGPPNTTNCPTGVQFRRDGGDPLVSGPASLSRGVMPRLRDEQAGLAEWAACDKTIISLAEEPDGSIRFKHGTLDRLVCRKCRSATAHLRQQESGE